MLALALALPGCGGDAASPTPVAARSYADPGFVRADGFEMRYGLVLASALNPAVAKAYGIVRSNDRAVLTVAVLRQSPGSVPVATEAQVHGIRRRLTGEEMLLEFRPILEGQAISYIAELDVGSGGPLLLEVEAVPHGGHSALVAKLTRQFDTG